MALAALSVSDGQNAGVLPNHQPHHDQTVAEIEEFFRYRPPTLCPAEDHTTSDKTRPPGKFDTHLDSPLRLRRVVYLPSIVDDLKEIAEGALKSASDTGNLPPITDKFPNPVLRETQIEESSYGRILCESQIETFYNSTTARFCSVVASTLEFQHPHWSRGHLEWTLDKTKSRGVADGYLRLNQKSVDRAIAPLPVDFKEVTEDFPVLALWEFKSLKAGTPEVFEAIVQQSAMTKDFPWQGCKEGKRCPIVHRGEDGGVYITGSQTAFDAQTETCRSILTNKPIIPDPPSSQPSEKAKIHARHMTQQAWTEAVNDDTTFVVINAGNIEIIGKRDRANQTLYISGVIDVTACDYGKLHTGLFIAAIRDAHDRTAQLRRSIPPPGSWTMDYTTRKPNSVAVIKMKSLLADILACDWLAVVEWPSYNHPFPFYRNSYWIRTPSFVPLIEQTREDLKHFIRLSVTKHLQSDTFRGRLDMNGVPFKGIRGECAETVVIKYAGTEVAIEKLEYEHQVIQELKIAGVEDIPQVIGLFFYQMVEENDIPQPMAALVMEDAGEQADGLALSNHHITAFVKALKSIHNAGFLHGNIRRDNLIIRNNIKPRNENQGVAIIGLGNAFPRPSNDEMADEHQKLMRLLPNPLKHTESGKHTQSFVDAYPAAAAFKFEVSNTSRPAKRRNAC